MLSRRILFQAAPVVKAPSGLLQEALLHPDGFLVKRNAANNQILAFCDEAGVDLSFVMHAFCQARALRKSCIHGIGALVDNSARRDVFAEIGKGTPFIVQLQKINSQGADNQ